MDRIDRRAYLKGIGSALAVSASGVITGTASGRSGVRRELAEIPADERLHAWNSYQADAKNSGVSSLKHKVTPDLAEEWSHDALSTYSPGYCLTAPGTVVVIGRQTVVTLSDPGGETQWKANLPTTPSGTPAIEDHVLAIPYHGAIRGFDLDTGDVLWTASVDGTPTDLIGVDGTFYDGLEGGTIISIDVETGETSRIAENVGEIRKSLAHDGERLFAASFDGSVRAWQSGELVWKTDVSYELRRAPTVTEDNLVVTSDGTMIAVDRRTGEEAWRYEGGIIGYPYAPASANGLIVAFDDGSNLLGVDQKLGQEIWSRELDFRPAAEPTMTGNEILLTDTDGNIRSFSFLSGTERWSIDAVDSLPAAGVVTGASCAIVVGSGGAVGLYLPESVPARRSIRLLDQTAATELEAVGSVPEGTTEARREARRAFLEGNYRTAREIAEEARSRILEVRESRHTAKEQISKLANEIAKTDGFEPAKSRDLLADAREAYQAGNYDRATSTAKRGLDVLERRRATRRRARTRIQELERALEAHEELVTDDSEALLSRAHSAFRNESFGKAESLASDGLQTLEKTVAAAKKARRAIEKLESELEAARDSLVVDKVKAMLDRAREAYEDGKYATATATAKNGIDRLNRRQKAAAKARKAIANAEEVSGNAAADRIADLLGYSQELQAARGAYSNGNYAEARETAISARQTYWMARVSVNSAFGVAVVTGTLYVRYPQKFSEAISRMQEIGNRPRDEE